MVEIRIIGDTVIFEVLGMHKIWALKSRVEVPAPAICAVRADPNVRLGWDKGLRLPGTHLPGVIVAGTYYRAGKKEFWDVSRPEKAIVVSLNSRRPYDTLIVDVEDPSAAIESLHEIVRRNRDSGEPDAT